MSVSENLKECPTCKTSGYVNEAFITISEHNKEVVRLKNCLEQQTNLLDKTLKRNVEAKYNFWDRNSWIFFVIIAAVVISVVAFAISNHTFQPDPPVTIGDKIEKCTQKSGKDRCICMSGYVSELPKEAQADYILLVNRCYEE